MRIATGLLVVTIAAVAISASAPARADQFGIRGGYYTKAEEPFLGAELLIPLSHSVYANPNLEYVFTERQTYMTFNADFHYDFPTHGWTYVWAGAGLAVLYSKPDGGGSTTDMGANFLFGVGRRGRVIPYVQAKLIAKDDTEFVIGAGLRF